MAQRTREWRQGKGAGAKGSGPDNQTEQQSKSSTKSYRDSDRFPENIPNNIALLIQSTSDCDE